MLIASLPCYLKMTQTIRRQLQLLPGSITTIYPSTAIAEAITTLLRKHSNPELASYLTKQYKDDRFAVEYIDEKIMKFATEIFNPKGSKQNTFFDALVAGTAKTLGVEIIFSFDQWYTKLGFTLASDFAFTS